MIEHSITITEFTYKRLKKYAPGVLLPDGVSRLSSGIVQFKIDDQTYSLLMRSPGATIDEKLQRVFNLQDDKQ